MEVIVLFPYVLLLRFATTFSLDMITIAFPRFEFPLFLHCVDTKTSLRHVLLICYEKFYLLLSFCAIDLLSLFLRLCITISTEGYE